MRRFQRPRIWPTFGAWFLATLSVLACRYSVRDTGFVDLGSSVYRLVLDLPASASAALPPEFSVTATRLLEDSNIEWSLQQSAGSSESPRLRLTDSAGRSLELSRDSKALGNPESLLHWVQVAAASPRREELLGEALQAYAVLVLVKGKDPAENERVRRIVESASATIQRLMPSMPKPVDTPPRLVSIPLEQQAAETVLIWGLGFDPAPAGEPRLAIVYGRGRRLGSTLEGPTITRTALQERLALIGQDCECDLDRAWLKGPILPGRWTRDLQQTASKLLGFDPENPMVRSEVSRIVLRGEGDHAKSRKPTTVLGLGYAEESIDTTGSEAVGAGDATGHETPLATSTSAPAASRPGVTPSQPEAAKPNTTPVWIALAGAFVASAIAGVWVAARNSRKHG